MDETHLPGYGVPVTARAPNCFPSALFDDAPDAPLTTVREFTMMEIMNRISDKADWHLKVFDDGITAKWKTETLGQPDRDVSEKMFDKCIDELRHKAGVFKRTDCVEALDGVIKSDTIIPEVIRLALIDAVQSLENVPEDQRDWHPRSDEKVLDLVHPSLYPLVYGQTRLLTPAKAASLDDWRSQFGLGKVSNVHAYPSDDDEEEEDEGEKWSKRFQWLPCDVDVTDVQPKIVSYINNLHPQKHSKLYQLIEEIIKKSMTLWEITLSIINQEARPARIEMQGSGYGEHTLPEPSYPSGDDDSELDQDASYDMEEAWRNSRPIIQPEPDSIKRSTKRDLVNLRDDWSYPTSRLQIIVKVATIHLTPASPDYGGGTWHVEGAANEAICASAIYYYQSENVSESLLSFRQRAEDDTMDLEYEQDDHRALETIFGFTSGEPLIQTLGKVVTRQGRLIAFPNVMQHRVEPFHLEDPTKPGYRKILALFLVDPHQRVISTVNVPPQQPEWWEEHLKLSDLALSRLPQELKDAVQANFPPMMGLEEAKRLREELMEERTNYAEVRNEEYEGGPEFSLCEH